MFTPGSPTAPPPFQAREAGEGGAAEVGGGDQGGEDEGVGEGGLSFAEKMMRKMGYVEGKGLGRLGQGRLDAVDVVDKQDRAGLGIKVKSQHTRQIGQLAGKYQALGTLDSILEMEVDVPWISWEVIRK